MNNTIDTSQLLSQLRLAAAQARSNTQQPQATQPANDSANFSSLLVKSIDQVNQSQRAAGELKTAFEKGDPNVQLTDVMITNAKAGLSFQAMVTVRNKMVDAYQEIMRMQV